MKNTIAIASAVILVGVFAFFVGTGFQRRLAFSGFYGRQFTPQIIGMSHRRGMGTMEKPYRGILQGQISKIENNTVTVQLPAGGTYNITLGDQTEIDKTTKVTKGELKSGQNITVFGGSFFNTAQTILINP